MEKSGPKILGRTLKKFILSVLILFSFAAHAQNKELSSEEIQRAMEEARHFIDEQNEEFRNPEESPLHDDSISGFHSLDYYPVDEKYIVQAKVKYLRKGREFEMQTTTDRKPMYRDHALIQFQLNGEEYVLHAYKNLKLSQQEEYKNYVFLPFNDHTNGIDTYGGGRYLDLELDGEKWIILNFNKSYNPYCAYNDRYSCPIPPEENKLELKIEAGVKKYH